MVAGQTSLTDSLFATFALHFQPAPPPGAGPTSVVKFSTAPSTVHVPAVLSQWTVQLVFPLHTEVSLTERSYAQPPAASAAVPLQPPAQSKRHTKPA